MVFRLVKSKYDSFMDYLDELHFKIIYFFDEDIYNYISETKLYILFILVPNILLIICTLGFIPSSLAHYIYLLLCIYSIYNTATFFSRSRFYQIYDDSPELDEIYEGSYDDSNEKYFQGNFFSGRPRARTPNLTRSIHPRFTEKYHEEHRKHGVFMRFVLLIVNIIEGVFHFFTFGFLRNDNLRLRGKRRVSRKVNDKKPKRKTFSERKEEEEKNNRPANMTTYYDDVTESNMNRRSSSLNGKKYIYEVEMWDYSQYDRALITYFSPIQVFAMYFIYYLYSHHAYSLSVLYTKIMMTIFIYLQSVFIDRIMIAFERRESDKQIIYSQTYREEVDFNNKLNAKRREAIRNYNEQLLHSGITLPTLEPVHFANAAYSGLGYSEEEEVDDIHMNNPLVTSSSPPRNSYTSHEHNMRTSHHQDFLEPKEQQNTLNLVTKRSNRKMNRQSEEIEVIEQQPPQASISQPPPITSSRTMEEPQKSGWLSGLWNSIFPSRKQKQEAQEQQSVSRSIQRTQTQPKDEEEDERRDAKRKQPSAKQPSESERAEEKKRKESVSNPFQQHRKKPKQ
ncbi:hypothetical protein FDP41_000473 [Naegleria fowleri]|uniref:Nuclear rim protein 1 n=1 Tax=Naegleria fowleri TaxID=5763 RepID=A0A6A5CDD4_NAEFO|nr:uncharacterized protein FDP41_000473 [Naegleria fowleri]KAF0984574.1 hypothetical protein FDP41_000473 [Naegleria fowleri]